MLKRLHLENVGPASVMDVEFADRLNVFTGDNGLGKSFLLDAAWWFIGKHIEQPLPSGYSGARSLIDLEIHRSSSDQLETYHLEFNAQQQHWVGPKLFSVLPDLVLGIYLTSDGSFSIFDSLRTVAPGTISEALVYSLSFLSDDLWNGLELDNTILCNGLISDWVKWQNQPDQTTFNLFWQVVSRLFPAHEQPLPGPTIRLSLRDVRDIPTIQLPYGQVPITHLSAGMQRILSLAYSLVWAWYENRQASKMVNVPPAQKLLLFIDEIELHLHPQWQRSIFPAILEAIKLLDPDIKVQVLTTTHSPLVLASLEPYFDEETDKLFGFDLVDREVVLKEMSWVKLGEVDDWLTSPIFGLSRPRSKEAEVAINAAFAIMRSDDMSGFPDHLRTYDEIDRELHQVLPDHDSFWRRWDLPAKEVKVR
jgi:AAA domain, putative AbiEii toxin, Type IV TA system